MIVMLVAREKEKRVLLDALKAEEAQFIAVYGRRRVGKTYLIRQTYDGQFTFEHSGLANADRKNQIHAFAASLKRSGLKVNKEPTNWFDAFELLKDFSTRNAWCGNSFERACLDHVSEIKAKLGISGVLTETHSWISKPDAIKKTKGAQIDLVLARKDRIINLCEMKYSFGKYTFTKKDADSLLNKIAAIKNASETKCSIHPVLVTPYGLTEGVNTGLIQAVIKAEDLFVKMV